MADMEEEVDASGDETEEMLTKRTRGGRDWSLFNVIILGFSFMFLFTAFQTCSMVEVGRIY